MAVASSSPNPKVSPARVAVFHIDAPAEAVVREAFKQFNIETVRVEGDISQRLFKEKFEACVVPLDHPEATAILEAARSSPSNRRLVIYAIAADSAETLRFSKHGLNVVLPRPLDRQAALRAVRASHLLVLHELRRYVRVPVVVEVKLESERGSKLTAATMEVSGGGMSLSTAGKAISGENVTVTFALPAASKLGGSKVNDAKVTARAIVCWARVSDDRLGEMMFGIRFQADDDRRFAVKEWIEAYLDM
ncbi:MAG: PilZ domain-containing protein [Acidobacteriota bacterium]|nr:PilZ domain-containing protein [Acidobacteriota bacterium]